MECIPEECRQKRRKYIIRCNGDDADDDYDDDDDEEVRSTYTKGWDADQ